MSASPPSPEGQFLTAGSFPKARHGYARGAVDDYVARLQRRLDCLQTSHADLLRERAGLADSLAELRAQHERLRTAGLDERALDILAGAEEEAKEVVLEGRRVAAQIIESARREAEVLLERARQELAWGRRQIAAERAELTRQEHAGATSSGPAATSPRAAPEAAEPGKQTADHIASQPA